MASRAPGHIEVSFDDVSVKIELKNGLKSPGWIWRKFDHFSIKNESKNGLKSYRLDSHEI